MDKSDLYLGLERQSTAIFKDRGSKFIAYAMPAENEQQVKIKLDEIRKQHPSATHVCYGFIINPLQPYHRANDDGEPSSTAGKPILGQIISAKISNALVAVVRYYGGTQLGVTGLINAYRTSAREAIQENMIVEKQIKERITIQCDHMAFNNIIAWVKAEQITYEAPEFGLFCTVSLMLPFAKKEQYLHYIKSIETVTLLNS